MAHLVSLAKSTSEGLLMARSLSPQSKDGLDGLGVVGPPFYEKWLHLILYRPRSNYVEFHARTGSLNQVMSPAAPNTRTADGSSSTFHGYFPAVSGSDTAFVLSPPPQEVRDNEQEENIDTDSSMPASFTG